MGKVNVEIVWLIQIYAPFYPLANHFHWARAKILEVNSGVLPRIPTKHQSTKYPKYLIFYFDRKLKHQHGHQDSWADNMGAGNMGADNIGADRVRSVIEQDDSGGLV